MYGVVIVGGSFAGLATALQLRGFRVVLIEQEPIGAHQTSACGTLRATGRTVEADDAILEVHNTLVLHTGGHTIRFPLHDSYVTFD